LSSRNSLSVLTTTGKRQIVTSGTEDPLIIANHWLAIAAELLGAPEILDGQPTLSEFSGICMAGHELESDPSRAREHFGLGAERSL
jgi:hypothetical protein